MPGEDKIRDRPIHAAGGWQLAETGEKSKGPWYGSGGENERNRADLVYHRRSTSAI
jgi:hypothetical protein